MTDSGFFHCVVFWVNISAEWTSELPQILRTFVEVTNEGVMNAMNSIE